MNQLPAWKIKVESHRHATSGASTLHSHPYPSLIVVTSGRGSCRLGDRNLSLSADTAVFVPPNVMHETFDQPGQPMNVFSVGFESSKVLLSSTSFEQLLNWQQIISLPVYESKQIHQLLRTLLHEQALQKLDFENAMATALSKLLIHLVRQLEQTTVLGSASYDSLSKVREVISGIELNYHEQTSLVDVAKMAHLSQRQFSNLCHQITGMNYVAFVNTVRCTKALELLTQSEMPVSAIAFEVGYEELSTFYRAFKKQYGKAPREMRGSPQSLEFRAY